MIINEKTTRFNIQDYLKTPEEVVEYFKVSLREDTPEEFTEAVKDILNSEGYLKIIENKEKNKNKNNIITMENIMNLFGFKLSFV